MRWRGGEVETESVAAPTTERVRSTLREWLLEGDNDRYTTQLNGVQVIPWDCEEKARTDLQSLIEAGVDAELFLIESDEEGRTWYLRERQTVDF